MREKFICQSAFKVGRISKALLVRDQYKGAASLPEYHFVNSTSEDYQEGDIWLIEHTLLRRGGSNGRSRRKHPENN